MKVAVLNFSGNVGKSTLCRHLLAPRMKGAKLVAVETINSDGAQGSTMRAKEFADLQSFLQTTDDAIVDVGASNVEEYLKLMRQFEGSHDDFDCFVVPTVPGLKQQRDTISTIEELADIGVAPDHIRLIFNMVEVDQNVGRVFDGLVAYRDKHAAFILHESAVIHCNELYPRISASGKTVAEILRDESDYKALIRATNNPEEKAQLASLLAVKRLAAGVSRQLDAVFTSVFQP